MAGLTSTTATTKAAQTGQPSPTAMEKTTAET